ncbi:hypothetical protein [Marinobacterium iners]|uniref:hypothetical protein n=1 Tax=Marinobacterium iners TaxID=48076 RepID=UPI0020C858C7|nr:hypothetical protein [Marinobacterium iners]
MLLSACEAPLNLTGVDGLVLSRTIGSEACADSSVIALGFDKQLWRSDDDGTSRQALSTPTLENLLDLTCAPDGRYWATGQAHPDHHLPVNKDTCVSIDDSLTMVDVQAQHCTTGQFKGIVDPDMSPQDKFTVQNMHSSGN